MRASQAALAILLATACSAPAADLGGLRPAAGAPRPGVELAQAQVDAGRVAALQARVLQLEEELRRLTGRVEEAEYAQQQTQARLDRLIADIDARLRPMEEGAGGTPPPVAAVEPEPAPPPAPPASSARREPLPAVVTPRQRTATPPAPQPQRTVSAPPRATPGTLAEAGPREDPAAARGYVLGTLPRDALVRQAPPSGEPPPPAARTAQAPSVAAPPRSAGPKLRYDAALSMLQAGDLDSAGQEFSSFVQDYPDDPLAPNAAYWLAETHYVQRDYQTAAALFARNYRTYGDNASKAPDNLLKLGLSLAALGDADKACQTFAELERRHANAPAPIRQELARAKAASACR